MKLKNNISNKKGFTMVELLATIVILGILSIVSIVAVNKILENSKKEYYKSLEETVRLAGESYVQNNRKYLPKYIGGKTVVPLEELQEQNYIKEVKDYNKNDCYTDKTYVQIFKYSKTKYTYRAYLNCPDYTNEAEIDDTAPSITINLSNDPSKISITFRGGPEGQDIELLSYRYIIYRDKKEISNTGDIEANSKKEVTVSLNLKESTPGKIKIKAVATNIYGQSTTVQNTKTYEDENPPICIIKDEDQITSPKSWTNSDRKITVECDDGDGLGCEQDEYSVNFNTTKQNGIITIRDSAGNETDCPVSVYVDKTAPSCTLDGTNTTWKDSTVTIKSKCNDDTDGEGGSGCTASSNKTFTYSTGTYRSVKISYEMSDNAGNTATCSKTASVYLDTEPPTTPTTGSIGTVSGSNTTASTGNATGSTDQGTPNIGSGIKEYRYCVTNTSTAPKNTDECFTTSRNFTRKCGTSYYGWAIAVDKLGHKSNVYSMGNTKDGANSYSAWGTCSAECKEEGASDPTQTRTNSCALVTTGLKQTCNTGSCCSEGNYSACDWVHSCRVGNTYIYTISGYNEVTLPAGQFAGTVTNSQRLRVIKIVGNWYYVAVEDGLIYGNANYNIAPYGWIYKECVSELNTTCQPADCPDLGLS